MIIIKRAMINTLALYLAALLFPSLVLGNPVTTIMAAILLSLLSVTIRPLLLVISLPFSLLTLGVFILVIDTWLLQLVDLLFADINIPGFLIAFCTIIMISILNQTVGKAIPSFGSTNRTVINNRITQ